MTIIGEQEQEQLADREDDEKAEVTQVKVSQQVSLATCPVSVSSLNCLAQVLLRTVDSFQVSSLFAQLSRGLNSFRVRKEKYANSSILQSPLTESKVVLLSLVRNSGGRSKGSRGNPPIGFLKVGYICPELGDDS